MIQPAKRLDSVQEYYFSQKLREVRELLAAGKPIINMGIGSPDLQPPSNVVEAIQHSLQDATAHKYQSYQGLPALRSAISAFYFDIRKDSLYCDNANNEVRRSARTVLYEVFKCLTAWLAPVICYTAEEAWLAYNGNENEDSIHLKQFPEIPENWINDELNDKWLVIRKIRKFLSKQLKI